QVDIASIRIFNSSKPEELPVRLKALVERFPNEPHAWRDLAQNGLKTPEERIAPLKRALELDGEDPGLMNSLAWQLAMLHRHEEALPYAERASRKAPTDYAIADTVAVVYGGLGRCDEAVRWEQRALDLLPEGDEKTRVEFVDRVKSF